MVIQLFRNLKLALLCAVILLGIAPEIDAQTTTTISGLPAGATPTGSELLPAWQSGKTVSLTSSQLANLGGSPNNPSVGSNGSTAPGSSTQVGYTNGSGNLQPIGSSNPMPVTVS